MHQKTRIQRHGRGSSLLHWDCHRKFLPLVSDDQQKVILFLTRRRVTKVRLTKNSTSPVGTKSMLGVNYTGMVTGKAELSLELKDCMLERKDESSLILNSSFRINFPKSMQDYQSKRDFLQLNVDFWETISSLSPKSDAAIKE